MSSDSCRSLDHTDPSYLKQKLNHSQSGYRRDIRTGISKHSNLFLIKLFGFRDLITQGTNLGAKLMILVFVCINGTSGTACFRIFGESWNKKIKLNTVPKIQKFPFLKQCFTESFIASP